VFLLYGLLLRLFPHYFYYTNPGDFVMNLNPYPCNISRYRSVFNSIQTSTEEYVLEGISCRDLQSDEE
jgi:hypothetical protein